MGPPDDGSAKGDNYPDVKLPSWTRYGEIGFHKYGDAETENIPEAPKPEKGVDDTASAMRELGTTIANGMIESSLPKLTNEALLNGALEVTKNRCWTH